MENTEFQRIADLAIENGVFLYFKEPSAVQTGDPYSGINIYVTDTLESIEQRLIAKIETGLNKFKTYYLNRISEKNIDLADELTNALNISGASSVIIDKLSTKSKTGINISYSWRLYTDGEVGRNKRRATAGFPTIKSCITNMISFTKQ